MPNLTDPNFKLPPIRPEKENVAADISVVKCETSLRVPKDNVRLNPESDYIVEQKRKKELVERLDRKRSTAELTRDKLEIQWRHLAQNELTFQRTIIGHNRFSKRNLEKRERASAKIQTDIDLTKKREKEIKALDQKYDFFNGVSSKMRYEIKRHNIYEDYMNYVVELQDSPFKAPFEFLTKYETSQSVKEHCVKRQTEEMAVTVLVHDNNVEFFRSQDVISIGLRNDSNNLRCQFDEVCRKNSSTETSITSIVNRTNESNVEVTSCQYMIDAIYRYVCQRRKIPHADYALRDVKPKIDTIKSTSGVWEQISTSSESSKKRKKSLRMGRKSYGGKASLAQAVFMWKRKSKVNSGLES